MDENSRNYWIVPIMALAIGCIIGAGGIEFKVNTVWPAAIAEMDELKKMGLGNEASQIENETAEMVKKTWQQQLQKPLNK